MFQVRQGFKVRQDNLVPPEAHLALVSPASNRLCVLHEMRAYLLLLSYLLQYTLYVAATVCLY